MASLPSISGHHHKPAEISSTSYFAVLNAHQSYCTYIGPVLGRSSHLDSCLPAQSATSSQSTDLKFFNVGLPFLLGFSFLPHREGTWSWSQGFRNGSNQSDDSNLLIFLRSESPSEPFVLSVSYRCGYLSKYSVDCTYKFQLSISCQLVNFVSRDEFCPYN